MCHESSLPHVFDRLEYQFVYWRLPPACVKKEELSAYGKMLGPVWKHYKLLSAFAENLCS